MSKGFAPLPSLKELLAKPKLLKAIYTKILLKSPHKVKDLRIRKERFGFPYSATDPLPKGDE